MDVLMAGRRARVLLVMACLATTTSCAIVLGIDEYGPDGSTAQGAMDAAADGVSGTRKDTGSGRESCTNKKSDAAASDSGGGCVDGGIDCGAGTVCHGGACAAGCEVDNEYSASSSPNPNNPCQTCQPGTSTTEWTNVTDGTSCGNSQVCDGSSCSEDEICNAGSCVTGCYIDGTFYAPNTSNPADACEVCRLASPTMWTIKSGVRCGTECCETGETCAGGKCCTATEKACGTECCTATEMCTTGMTCVPGS